MSSEILTKTDSAAMIGVLTHAEIVQQPELWLDTFDRVAKGLEEHRWFSRDGTCVFTGAGSSAYAGVAIQAAFPGAGRFLPRIFWLILLPALIQAEFLSLWLDRATVRRVWPWFGESSGCVLKSGILRSPATQRANWRKSRASLPSSSIRERTTVAWP